jgi:uracil-DNA glycosylase
MTSLTAFCRSITSFFGAPKPTAAKNTNGAALAGSPITDKAVSRFDKAAWVAKLTDEQKQLLALEINTLHESWLAQLKDEIVTKEFLDLKRFLKKEVESGQKVFPPSQDVYSW